MRSQCAEAAAFFADSALSPSRHEGVRCGEHLQARRVHRGHPRDSRVMHVPWCSATYAMLPAWAAAFWLAGLSRASSERAEVARALT